MDERRIVLGGEIEKGDRERKGEIRGNEELRRGRKREEGCV